MAQACNPSTLGGWGRWITRSRDRDHPGQHGETPSLLKNTKNWLGMVARACNPSYSGGWGRRIAWTQEAQRLRWAEIAPLHSSLGNESKTPSQKIKIKRYPVAQVIFLSNTSTFWEKTNEHTTSGGLAIYNKVKKMHKPFGQAISFKNSS